MQCLFLIFEASVSLWLRRMIMPLDADSCSRTSFRFIFHRFGKYRRTSRSFVEKFKHRGVTSGGSLLWHVPPDGMDTWKMLKIGVETHAGCSPLQLVSFWMHWKRALASHRVPLLSSPTTYSVPFFSHEDICLFLGEKIWSVCPWVISLPFNAFIRQNYVSHR